jgi:hypothetical protein
LLSDTLTSDNQKINDQTNEQFPLKPEEPDKCWSDQLPQTTNPKFNCNFGEAVNDIVVATKNMLAEDQALKEDQYISFHTELTQTEQQHQLQQLVLSFHASGGTNSTPTSSLIVTIEGQINMFV